MFYCGFVLEMFLMKLGDLLFYGPPCNVFNVI